jgi:hypothetical protein
MQERRHPNPQLDPRRPRDGAPAPVNPPVFVWKPQEGQRTFGFRLARDEKLTETVLAARDLDQPYYLPAEALAPGRYWWTWSADGDEAPACDFVIAEEAPVVEVPPVSRWLEILPREHPRLYTRPEELAALRASRSGERAPLWARLQAGAEKLLAEPHEMAEPPYLPDVHTDNSRWQQAFQQAMHESRAFLGGAERLALAYLASGEERYGRAAVRRMLSVAAWDPAGSTHIEHNDEPHMSVVNWGPYACDWVWDLFTEEERDRLAAHFRRRGQLAYRFIHSFGYFGATTYGSHHGREIIFLATLSLVFHDRIPEAKGWLEWLRTLLCGVWPVWAGEDGAWAEGPDYGAAYVSFMLRFAAALKGAGIVDLFGKPFWPGHLEWRRHCVPAGVEWVGFGDGPKEGTPGKRDFTAKIVRTIAALCDRPHYELYARQHTAVRSRRGEGEYGYASSLHYLLLPEVGREALTPGSPERDGPALKVFPGAGWGAVRTHVDEPEKDIALTVRASPYGSVSHSHADNNDFSLHVAGRSLLLPSGFYDGYASAHHAHWTWHTKAANCVTLSDAGQRLRSPESTGALEDPCEDERLCYVRGVADASYQDLAARCRRHILYLKRHQAFLLVDEVALRPGVAVGLQWNVHGWSPFAVEEEPPVFRLERDGAAVHGHILWQAEGFFTRREEAEPPPVFRGDRRCDQPEYHLRYTPYGIVAARNLGVLLLPLRPGEEPPAVATRRTERGEEAALGGDTLCVFPDGPRDIDGRLTVAELTLDGQTVRLGDGPLRHT